MILVATSILALSHAATVVPTESSSVNVKQSGKDYSYSIQQNHGIAVETPHTIHHVPTAKLTQIFTSGGSSHAQKESHQDQIQQGQIQNRLSEKTQNEADKPQEQVKVIDYTVPKAENQLQSLPSNVVYILPYTFGIHYPQQFIRYI